MPTIDEIDVAILAFVSDHKKSNITQNLISSKKAEIKIKLDEILFKLRDLKKL